METIEGLEHLTRGELQHRAQLLIKLNGVELGDDPRTEVEVALAMGFLTLPEEVHASLGVPQMAVARV